MFNKEKIEALRGELVDRIWLEKHRVRWNEEKISELGDYVTLIDKRYEKLWEMQQKILGFLDVDLKTTEAKTELVSRKKK